MPTGAGRACGRRRVLMRGRLALRVPVLMRVLPAEFPPRAGAVGVITSGVAREAQRVGAG
jgi:hypothetical protein